MVSKIRLKNLKKYLEDKNWNISEFNSKAYKVSLNLNGQEYHTLIPNSEEIPDYEIVIEKFIEFVSSIEERSYTKIIEEIENVGYDVLQIRLLAGQSEDGTRSKVSSIEITLNK